MGKVIYDMINKKGDLKSLTLESGKSYTILFNQSIDKFKMPDKGIFNISGTNKNAVIMNLSRADNNYTNVTILIPKDNPFPVLIAVYAVSLLIAGIAIRLGTDNIVKITEDVTSPLGIIALFAVIYLFVKVKK